MSIKWIRLLCIIVVFYVFMTLIFGRCTSRRSDVYKKVHYEKELELIAHNLGELISPDEPLSYTPFSVLYQHADWYVEDAISVLRSQESTLLMKRLAVYNMQGVSKIDDYLTFFENLIMEFEAGNIEEDLCFDAMGTPPYILFLKHYKNDREQALLNRLSGCSRTSDNLREHISNILSGEALATALEWW